MQYAAWQTPLCSIPYSSGRVAIRWHRTSARLRTSPVRTVLIYAVTTLKDGYEVKSPKGEVVKFLYDQETDSWSQVQNGKKTEIFRFNDDGTI